MKNIAYSCTKLGIKIAIIYNWYAARMYITHWHVLFQSFYMIYTVYNGNHSRTWIKIQFKECNVDLNMQFNNKSLLHIAACCQAKSSIKCLIELGHDQGCAETLLTLFRIQPVKLIEQKLYINSKIYMCKYA